MNAAARNFGEESARKLWTAGRWTWFQPQMATFHVSEESPYSGFVSKIPDVDMWHMEKSPRCLFDLAHIKGMFLKKGAGRHIRYMAKILEENTLLLIVLELSPFLEHHC